MKAAKAGQPSDDTPRHLLLCLDPESIDSAGTACEGTATEGDLFPRLIEKRQLPSFEVSERFYRIGTPEGLEELRQYMGRVA